MKIPVYTSRLTKEFIVNKGDDFGFKEKDINFHLISGRDDNLRIGSFTVVPFHVNHSVPQSLGLMIRTDGGNVFHVSDYKFDWTPVDEAPFDVQKACSLASEKKPVLLLSDCLGAANQGHTESEATIEEALDNIIVKAKGKVIVTTISSNISRMKQAIQAAVNNNRKVGFVGRSIEASGEIAEKLGYLRGIGKHFVNFKKIGKLADNKQCLIVAGCYGQQNSSLVRASLNKHPFVKIKKSDTVIFSADPAPPQVHIDVNKTIDRLNRLGAKVYYYEIQDNLHVSGHGTSEDVKALMAMIKPRFLMPIGGDYRHMYAYSMLAQQMGWKDKEVLLLDEEQIVTINREGHCKIT
jgi:ribonuclease J